MQIDGYVQALREDLARIAAVGDESTARAAELLAGALESALGRRLLEAIGEAALELSNQLEEGRVEVRFAGGYPELVFVHDEETAAVEPADEAFTARITLRLPVSRARPPASAAGAAGACPATAGAERSRDVLPVSQEQQDALGLRRSVRRPRGPADPEPARAASRTGRGSGRDGRPYAVRLARPRDLAQPPPHHPQGDLRWPSIA